MVKRVIDNFRYFTDCPICGQEADWNGSQVEKESYEDEYICPHCGTKYIMIFDMTYKCHYIEEEKVEEMETSIKNKVIDFIKTCKEEAEEEADDCEKSNKIQDSFTEEELKYMDIEDCFNDDYSRTKDPDWCRRFDIITNWIYKQLENEILNKTTKETELYFWYRMNL